MFDFDDFDFMSSIGEDGDVFSTSPPPPLSTHCNVPLKYNKQRAALGKPAIGQYYSRNNQYKREFAEIQKMSGSYSPDFIDLCHIQDHILNAFCPISNSSVLAELEQQNRVALSMWRQQSMSIQSILTDNVQFPDYNLTESQKQFLSPYYLRKVFLEEAVLCTGSQNFIPKFWWKKTGHLTWYRDYSILLIGTGNLLFIEHQRTHYLVSRDHLLILSDLASQRYALIKYSLLSTFHPQCPFVPPGMLIEYFEVGDRILKYGGNEAYSLISKIEPLCLSFLIGELPVGSRGGQLFQNLIISEMKDVSLVLGVIHELDKLISIMTIASTSPSYITELYGLYRIWGHPTVDPLEGAAALKKVATPVRISNIKVVNMITNKFKEEFICRYIMKEHNWPSLDLSNLPKNNVICQAYEQKSVFPNKHRKYNRNDLNLIKFNQLFPIDPKFDLIELIADKALSLITPELITCISKHNNCGTASERSVLLNWLKSPIQDPEEFLKYIDVNGFPQFEKSNGVREKEREEKLKARMFGLMTLFKRMYIVLTEALLSEHLIPYFPEITMIDDELSLDKKRQIFTATREESDNIIISLDFSKWNSNMRKGETLPLFNCFDQMFGFTNCFSRTHEMFEDSAIYLLNGTYLPQIDQSGKLKPDIGCWYGHLGGIEGLRQKGWTIWTVSLILLASENLSFQLTLLGQGDNQILNLRFPSNLSKTECENIMYTFLDKLNELLAVVGPPLKLEETWASRVLFVYGKYIIYKGVSLPTSAKRIGRILRLSNEDYPTLESALSSATANLTAALANHYCIGPLFILYLSEIVGIFQLFLRSTYLQHKAFNHIFSSFSTIVIPGQRKQFFDVPVVLKNDFLQSDLLFENLCLYPRSLGGFPIMNIFDCLLRGFPDEVSYDIASLKIIYKYSSSTQQKFIKRMCSPPINKERNFQLIAEHPTVLNLQIPPAPGESRRNMIIEFLKSGALTLNKYVSTFMEILDSDEDKQILTLLEFLKPFNPRILSVFMAATVEARARHVAGKLQKTKTIATVARQISNLNLYRKIADAERNHFGSVLRLLYSDSTNTISWNESKCSVDHADQLRNLSWGRTVVGVNCVPPQEFMILELQLVESQCQSNFELDKGYACIRLDPTYKSETFNSPFIKGSFPPYRGSVTRQKVSGYGDKIASQSEPLIQKVLRLFSMVGWGFSKESSLHKLAQQLLARHTNLTDERLCPPDEEITGSVHHRLQDLRTGHGGSVPILPNYGTKLMFDTFPLVAYSKGSKNVNLMFQSFMSASVVLLGEYISHNWTSTLPVIHIHVKSSCCVQEISDELCDIPEYKNLILTCYDTNPYLYVKEDKITLLMEKGLRFEINRELGDDITQMFHRYHSILAEECFHLLSPHSWDKPTYHFRTQQLVINWVLQCTTNILLHNLALRICSHYTGAIRENTVTNFLMRVCERLERSPTDHWKSLCSLIFAPNINHHISGPGVLGKVSGNPLCSESTFAIMIKEAVITIIQVWMSNPKSTTSLEYIDLYGRPYCGLSQHPSLLLITRDWLMGMLPTSIFIPTKYSIIHRLTKKKVIYESHYITTLTDHYTNLGIKRISGESLDFLCKKEGLLKELPIYPHKFLDVSKLPKGGEVLFEINEHNLLRNKYKIIETKEFTRSPQYINHLYKIASTPTTGTYKCLSILNNLKMYEPSRIACLGDGGGGFTLGCLIHFPTTKVFFNTLVSKEIPIQQCSPIPFIPSLSGRPELECRIMGKQVTTDIVSDITEQGFSSMIGNRVSSSFDLIMCDAEYTSVDSFSKGLNLLQGTLKLSVLTKCDIVVFKAYFKNISLLIIQLSLVSAYYRHVEIFRSQFSSYHNTEIYIIGRDLGKRKHLIETSPGIWEGYIISPKIIETLYLWKDYLLTEPYVNIREISQCYTKIILGKQQYSPLNEFYKYVPFSIQNSHLTYPIDISRWIIETSSKKVGTPQITRIRLETTTLHKSFLRRWAIAYLVTLVLTDVEYWIPKLQEKISSGCLLWYRQKNKEWDTSLLFDYTPPSPIDKSYRVYPLPDIMNPSDHKLIFRLIGIGLTHNISGYNCASTDPREIRGHLGINYLEIHDSLYAENPWIRDKIQYGTTCIKETFKSKKKPQIWGSKKTTF